MTDLAIIIVSWNVRELLAGCLRSVEADLAGSDLSAEIWVVDNASGDGSVDMVRREFPQVKLIAGEQNLGFAGGNNAALRAMGFSDVSVQGVEHEVARVGRSAAETVSRPCPELDEGGAVNRTIRGKPAPFDTTFASLQSTQDATLERLLSDSEQPAGVSNPDDLPETVLLLNPDTEIHPGALQTLFDFLGSVPGAGVVGARLIYGDGSFQHSAFAFPGLWQLAIELLPRPGRLVESRLNGRYPRALYERGRPFRIGHPLGAAMGVRREAIQQVGLLDERYQMYVEEVDWSKRIVAAGWEAYCVPQALITHFGGQSAGQIKSSSFINLWASRYKFYAKHYPPLKLWLARRIACLGMQRKARQDNQAAKQSQLTPAELAERLACYQAVTNIWQGKQDLTGFQEYFFG